MCAMLKKKHTTRKAQNTFRQSKLLSLTLYPFVTTAVTDCMVVLKVNDLLFRQTREAEMLFTIETTDI